MGSEFDDFNSLAFGDAADVMGREEFTIGGIDETFYGLLNEFTCERDLMIGGRSGTYTATILCALADFIDVDGLEGPLERALEGKRVQINGRDFKIDRAAHDGSSLTLGLSNPSKGK